MNSLPTTPQRLATKDDLAVLSSQLRLEMRDLTTGQTWMLDLVGSVAALSITQLVIAALG